MGRASQPGPRSLDVLSWIARLGASTTGPVAGALGMSPATTYDHVSRLRAAGLLERWPTFAGDHLLAPTQSGWHLLGRPYPRSRPRPHEWEHTVMLAGIAAWLATTPTCTWWRAEREYLTSQPPAEDRGPDQWLMTYPGTDRHGQGVMLHRRADLMANLAGALTAIEGERTQKSKVRLQAILTGWGTALSRGDVDRVIYVVPDQSMHACIQRAIETAATAAPALTTDAFMILNTTQLDPHPVAGGHAGGGGHIDAERRAPARAACEVG